MQYVIMTYEAPEDFAARNGDASEFYWAGWRSYTEALREAGVLVGGNALTPIHTATTLSTRNGKRHVHDGPYADSKEQLGGYFVIEVPDLDAALAWAARCPCVSRGSVEIRPILQMTSSKSDA
jgi:hypothetical protein